MVQAQVGGQAVEPGGKAALPLKGGEGFPRLEKGILGQIQSILTAARHPQRKGIDPFFVVPDQLFEGVLVPVPGAGRQLLVSHTFTPSKSKPSGPAAGVSTGPA